jgi:tetratricopeptide (TPR) repeat protein
VLQQASVVGRLFWDRLVVHIQAEGGNGSDPQLVPLALSTLRGRELIYRREESAFSGAVEFLFKHDVLREVTYESVLKRLRKTYHGLVGDWLIANSGERINEYNGLIAEHLLLAGKSKQACGYFRQAGDAALASYANFEGEGYYRQALDLSPHDSLRADLLTGLGEALFRQAQSKEAKSVWQQAIDLYRDLGDSDRMADVYSRLSRLAWNSEGYLKAWNVCQEGLGLMEGTSDSPGFARLLAEAGRMAHFRNVSEQVIPLCQRAQEMAERLGDLEVAAIARITLTFQEEDVRESMSILEEVIAVTEANKFLRTAARAHNNMGVIMNNNLIDLHSALLYFTRSAEIFRQIGNIEGMMFSLNNVLRCSVDLGELNTVKDMVADFLRESTVSEAQVEGEMQGYKNDPITMVAKGEWLPALDVLRTRVKKFRQTGSIQIHANNNSLMANTILELNRFGYLDDLSEAENALKENIEIEWNVLESNFILAIVYARQGRYSEASALLAIAKNSYSQQETNESKVYHSNAKFELAFAEERWGDAVPASESSIGIYQNCGYRLAWARRLIDLGDALIGRKEPGDLERAQETYKKSLDMFTEMGAPGYIKVLDERLKDF